MAAVLAIATCQSVVADDADEPMGEPAQQDTEDDTEVSVVTSDSASASGGQAGGGPSVEFITGGSSTDGAAKVGRLPIID